MQTSVKMCSFFLRVYTNNYIGLTNILTYPILTVMDVTNQNDFSELQQQALQLTADMDSGTDLPRVERNLNQILEAGQRLLAKVGPISQDNTDVKA